MLLRRFYIQENQKGIQYLMAVYTMLTLIAPNPRPKKHRKLNTEFDE